MADIERQVRQMADFIKLEAKEKAAEIRAKAVADANLEKQNVIREAKAKIADDYDRKEKALAIEQKIKASSEESKQRSRLLTARDNYMQKLGEEARQRLKDVASSNPAAYSQLLKDLILQVIKRFTGESSIIVQCRPQDISVAKQAASAAAEQFASSTGQKINVTVTENNSLNSSAGGVVVTTQDGRQRCSNLLEDRLELALTGLTPVIRDLLFPSARARAVTKPPPNFPHKIHSAPAPAPAPAVAPVDVFSAF